jgi:glutamate dehydrogenase (NAD(P)+)
VQSFLEADGAKVICIAEYEGAIYNADGINEEDLFQHRKSTGSILNFPGCY